MHVRCMPVGMTSKLGTGLERAVKTVALNHQGVLSSGSTPLGVGGMLAPSHLDLSFLQVLWTRSKLGARALAEPGQCRVWLLGPGPGASQRPASKPPSPASTICEFRLPTYF